MISKTDLKKPEKLAALLLSVILTAASFAPINNAAYASTSNQNEYRLSYEGNMYAIEYDIQNATLDNVKVSQERQGLIMQLGNTTTPDGKLTVTLPRNLIDSVCGNEDLPFIIMMNGDELVAGRDPNASEIATTAESRTVTLTFPSQTMDIFIGVFSSPSLSTCNSLALTPNEQKNGVEYDVQDSLDVGNIAVDKERSRIIISLGNITIRDGFLKLELSRDVINSQNDAGSDMPFVVAYSTGEEESRTASYHEISSTNTVRTLIVELPAGSREITISGMQVIPEFGLVATFVMAVALLGVMALRAKRHPLVLLERKTCPKEEFEPVH